MMEVTYCKNICHIAGTVSQLRSNLAQLRSYDEKLAKKLQRQCINDERINEFGGRNNEITQFICRCKISISVPGTAPFPLLLLLSFTR